jgi:hypothetical protein
MEWLFYFNIQLFFNEQQLRALLFIRKKVFIYLIPLYLEFKSKKSLLWKMPFLTFETQFSTFLHF